MTLLIAYFLLAVVVSFICSLLEAVILSLNHAHIASMIEKGKKSGRMLKRLKEKIDHPLAAILTLNTVANTVGAAGVGAQALAVFGNQYVAVFSALLTFAILVFSEIIPKTLGAVYWKQIAGPAAYAIQGLIFAVYPLVIAFEALAKLISPDRDNIKITREEVRYTAEVSGAEGELVDRERSVIANILRLKNISVREIMTPRPVVFALPQDDSVGRVLSERSITHFSRIPIYGKDVDDITGLVHRYAIHQAHSQGKSALKIKDLSRRIKVVPETKSVAEVLEEFILRREHLFLVVDEYGGTAGIITLEDAIETLLGEEIVDELDSVEDMQKYALERWERRLKKQNKAPIPGEGEDGGD